MHPARGREQTIPKIDPRRANAEIAEKGRLWMDNNYKDYRVSMVQGQGTPSNARLISFASINGNLKFGKNAPNPQRVFVLNFENWDLDIAWNLGFEYWKLVQSVYFFENGTYSQNR